MKRRITGIKKPVCCFFVIITDIPRQEYEFLKNIGVVKYPHLLFLPRSMIRSVNSAFT